MEKALNNPRLTALKQTTEIVNNFGHNPYIDFRFNILSSFYPNDFVQTSDFTFDL